jgi:hypothetical protein
MTALPRLFRVLVIAAVTLTGTAFGALTGSVYSVNYWWVGMIAGGGSGFFLAWLYLFALSKLPPRLHGAAAWTLGTLVAVGCGVLCTLVAHGVMWALTGDSRASSEPSEIDLRELYVPVGVMFGVFAGFVVGGICSFIYVRLRKEPTS